MNDQESKQSRALDRLDRDIQRLQIEFARTLAGDRERPPQELRDELHARVSNLRASPNPSTADRFRLGSLAARLASQNELFDRRLNQQRTRKSVASSSQAILAGGERSQRAVRRLYEDLYRREKQRTSRSAFETFLNEKVREIRNRTGCTSVLFRVVDQGGKKTLKAKPIGRPGSKSASG